MPSITTSSGLAIPEQAAVLRDIINRGQDFFALGPEGVGGFNTFVPFAPETEEGLTRSADLARQGSPVFNAASQRLANILQGDLSQAPGLNTLAQTASGQFLSPGSNPFLQQVFNKQIAPGIRDNVNAQFLGSGRFGSAANTRVLADSLGNAANNLFGQNFARERTNQLNAANNLASSGFRASTLAPTFQGARFGQFGNLLDVGGQREALEQARINEPVSRLAQLQSLAFGGPVPTFSRQPTFDNRLAGILGGGLAGAQIGGQFGDGTGALIGGLIGGGLGAFG